MSVNIPLDIQAEILKRLPIKSLIRFRSVSKPWKSLIGGSKFISDFNLGHIEPLDLLVSYYDNKYKKKYVSFIDDHTFPQHKFPLTLSLPVDVNQINFFRIIGSSQGLFCFYNYRNYPIVSKTKTAVIWNPSIRKTFSISVPNLLETVIGFGVCPHTSDPKLVKFTYIKTPREFDSSQVEICNSKSNVWRTLSSNLPRKSIALKTEHVAIGRFIYWLGFDRNRVGGGANAQCYHLILLFDITNEEFTEEIYLPYCLTHSDNTLSLSKLRESLVVLETYIMVGDKVFDAWMMENGVPNSFKKLYTIKVPNALRVFGFRKSGQPLINMITDSHEDGGVFVYETDTEHVSYIGISSNGCSCFASSYVESLLLLDH